MAGTRLGPHCLSNNALYDRVGSWPLRRHVDRSRLRYLGHICRMPDGSLTSTCSCHSVGGCSPPAPPPQTA
eukprot:196928-Chlamydomonas_euryale.AAC.1